MKTYKIKKELFNEIANKINFDDVWQDIIDNESEITGGQYLPRLAGGLSHYVWTAKKIEIHDIGTTNGSYVQDNSFRIIPEKIKIMTTTEIIESAFLGYLTSEGQTYCTVYDSKLDSKARGLLLYGEDGTLQRDVWSQVSFMTPEEFEKIFN